MKSTPETTRTETLGRDANHAALPRYGPFVPANVGSPALWLATEPRDGRHLNFESARSLTPFEVAVVFPVASGLPSSTFSVV
jgi:hypothetical protein